MKPKEWLVKNGHIKEAGRGRMSKEQIALVTEAAKSVYIEGYSTPALAPVVSVERTIVEKPNGDKTVIEHAPIIYPHDVYEAVYYINSKRHTADTKQACNQHGLSLCGHECPGALISVAKYGTVTISHIERKSV